MADPRVDAMRSSVARLRDLAATMTAADLGRPAYPSEWSVADVLSHIGSGAVIMHRRLDDTLAGTDTPDDFAPQVWETWNAKTPAAQREDALAADAALLKRVGSLTDREREGFRMAMGPMHLDFGTFVGMRLNEHALHTWDIEVSVDPVATIPQPVAAVVVDNLEMISRYTARPTGDTTTITVATTEIPRGFTVALTPDSVSVTPAAVERAVDLELSAEAFIRLVYGRLDPEHVAQPHHSPALDLLRRVFPGP